MERFRSVGREHRVVLSLRALAHREAFAIRGVRVVEPADAVQRGTECGARDRDLDVVGTERRGEVLGGAPQLTLGFVVAAELGRDRRELTAIGGRSGVAGSLARSAKRRRRTCP